MSENSLKLLHLSNCNPHLKLRTIKEIECHSAIVQLGRKCHKLSFAVYVGDQDVSAARHRLRLRRMVASSQDNANPGGKTYDPVVGAK